MPQRRAGTRDREAKTVGEVSTVYGRQPTGLAPRCQQIVWTRSGPNLPRRNILDRVWIAKSCESASDFELDRIVAMPGVALPFGRTHDKGALPRAQFSLL